MYLEKYEQYLGTGERNAAGLDLKTFLEEYNPKLYDTPANTVDNLIFTYVEENGKKRIGKILLIKRGNHPSIGWWALPGGFVDFRENLDIAAARELEEETGYRSDSLEFLISVQTTVAFCNEKIDVFVARNLKKTHQHLDEDECVEVEAYDVDELIDMIYAGKLQDGKTMAAIMAYKLKYAK